MPFTKGHKIWLGKKHSEQSKKLMSSKQKGKIISLEQRKNRSLIMKSLGIIPPSRKGIKASEETRLKMSISRKGKKIKSHVAWNKGKNKLEFPQLLGGRKKGFIVGLETRKKIRISRLGKKATPETRERQRIARSGIGSYFWKGGLTIINHIIRKSFKYRQWRSDVFNRDEFYCQKCGIKSGSGKTVYLEAHHINSLSSLINKYKITTMESAVYCEELWDINNGITLCKKCHKETDNYGRPKK